MTGKFVLALARPPEKKKRSALSHLPRGQACLSAARMPKATIMGGPLSRLAGTPVAAVTDTVHCAVCVD
jgi:hypothetical protein